MCPDCRERYLEVRGNRENLQHSADISDSQSILRAPDLLDYIEQAYNGNVWLQHHRIINIWWKVGGGDKFMDYLEKTVYLEVTLEIFVSN